MTLFISAYNEEEIIEEKLRNTLELDYPNQELETIVVSDGSTDRTPEIVGRFADRGVILRHYEERIGKTGCLNRAIPSARGEILVFSDANAFYDRDAVRHLVRNFQDARVGFVTGHTKYAYPLSGGALAPVGLYAKLETWTKRLESRIGSCVGADGAIFAIRKERYSPLHDEDINDFVMPLQIIQGGFRGVLEEQAYCIERTGKSPAEEFRRQVRITSRTLRALFKHSGLLNPLRYPLFAYQLTSHKFLKLLMPFLLVLLFVANAFLVMERSGTILLLTFVSQIGFYSLSAVAQMTGCSGPLARAASLSHVFLAVNVAVLIGWKQYLRGEHYRTWVTNR